MANSKMSTILVVLMAVTVMVVTWAFYAFFAREVTQFIEGKHHWFHDYEPWSLFGFIAVFIAATALFLPAQPFVVATGYLFGFHFLTLLFTVAVYALAAFLMFNGARFWFRPLAEGWLREHKIVLGMSQYVKDKREGAKLNLLFSFMPISFCIHCYVMGITEIDEFIFMFTFLLGQSPHIVFGLLTGSALLEADTNNVSLGSFKIALLALGIVGTMIAMVYQDILKNMEDGITNQNLIDKKRHLEEGTRCGVGITFAEADDMSLEVAVISPGTPAAECGRIRVRDVLYEIDRTNVFKAKLDLITRLVPGCFGTEVELGFRRGKKGPANEIFRVRLMRRPVAVLTKVKTYGTAQTQTPPVTPSEESGRRVTWEHPEVIVSGRPVMIDEAVETFGEYTVTDAPSSTGLQASVPVMITVQSQTHQGL